MSSLEAITSMTNIDSEKSTLKTDKQYFYYTLLITPNDSNAGNVKNIVINNFNAITKYPSTKRNSDVADHFKHIKHLYCPAPQEYNDNVVTYYAEFTHTEKEIDYEIECLFIEIQRIEDLTHAIMSGEKRDILTYIMRTINDRNNFLPDHDNYYNCTLENLITDLSQERFYDLTPLTCENKIKTKLFDYQLDNVNWAINIEQNKVKDYISCDKLITFTDGRTYNYTFDKFITNADRKLINVKGGIIMDDVGIGKSLQALAICVHKDGKKTIILCPDHLKAHWGEQKTMHLIDGQNITIVGFSEYVTHNGKYDRMIVDEIHELYTNVDYKNTWEKTLKTGIEYKWGLTATPFGVTASIYNLMKFLTEQDLTYCNIDRAEWFQPLFKKIFRKNILENISKEIQLPPMNIQDIFVHFTSEEKMIYTSEQEAAENTNIELLRKICCDVTMNFDDCKSTQLSLNDFNTLVLLNFKSRFDDESAKYNAINVMHENTAKHIKENQEKNLGVEELVANLKYYKNEMAKQEKNVNNRKKAYEYLKYQMESSKICPMCLDEIEDGMEFDVPKCNHIFCHPCLTSWLTTKSTCPTCFDPINKADIYTITDKNEMKMQYGTKINKMLNIIKATTEKFVIYTQFESLIEKFQFVLGREGIKSIVFKTPNDIEAFRTPDVQVIIISSKKNASGINLTFAQNIVIFEPVMGTFSFLKDVEKQIIGRIYRITQEKEINVYRLIVKDTIEEKIYNQEV